MNSLWYAAAELSLAAYSQADVTDTGTDTQVLVTDGAIAFRGTSSPQDWLTDLDIALVDTPLGMVHAGFWGAYQSIATQLPPAGLITGHSLGGALALLCGLDRLYKGEDVQIVTFGQPRALGTCTAHEAHRLFGTRIARCVHNNDVVPRMPPRLSGYGHAGQLVYFDRDGEYLPNVGWGSILLDCAAGRLRDLGRPGTDGIKDHNMSGYLVCAEKARDRA